MVFVVVVTTIIWPYDFGLEALVTLVLALYVLFVVFITLPLYKLMVSRGVSDYSARYYNRKIIHMFAGGLVAVLTPYLYTSPLFPLLASLALAFLLAVTRRYRLLYWFQVPENAYEVNFLIAWGVSVFLLWHLTANPFIAVLPAIFISYGDAVTGLIRNAIFGERTKHWWGNVAMAIVCFPIGYMYAGLLGLAAAAASTIVERFEFGPIDDNVLIVLTSTLILLYPYYIYL
ncbi:MAG: dolichol kinase [Acidilobaceae archaeon]